ncbi:MAG: MnhB domain-containing protein [Terriglobales bacterium]
MSRGWRIFVFVGSAIALFFLYLWGLHGLSPFGHYPGPYGDVINQLAVYERHATDAVTAVNFDYRGFDTLGEEFILFISVVGCTLLLRQMREETREDEQTASTTDEAPERRAPAPTEALKVTTLALIGPLVVFGVYIVTHGQLSPGGGFQGGVILATAPLLVYLAGDLKTFKHITSHTLVEISEAVGAFGYVLIGLLGMAAGAAFLQNVLPLGQTGAIHSSGTIIVISISVGLEVAAGFVLLLHAFLEQTLEIRLGGQK